MTLDPLLLEILACPEDKGPLLYFPDEDSLYNPRLHRRYAVRDDIPIMLVDEAESVDDTEHSRLVSKARSLGIKPTFDPDKPVRSVGEAGSADEAVAGGGEAASAGEAVTSTEESR